MSSSGANRWNRFVEWDERPLRLDKFAREDDDAGFKAFASRNDPTAGLVVENGRVRSMDGVPAEDFDMIDIFIVNHHLDLAVAEEAMAMAPRDLARMLVDISVPREECERLARGLTPARLAEVAGELSGIEAAFAYSKMRQRRTPGNQAHVTNAKDDPIQLAADAATAVAFGFDEIETTMRVAGNAWSNALACTVGAAVGRPGVLFQCSSEEAEELRIGMAGLSSYAETVSVYGTEESFVDGDDTPWSKAFLAAAYASRGIKARCTSGAGAELLMGAHEGRSLLYLEARCLCLQRAMGVQGTQNGGVDGAPVTASVPAGFRELMAENLIAVWLGLECASGNDARPTESEIRVGAKIAPYLLAGSDLICSGFGSILKYDNSFNPSLLNGEEMEDYLVLQRDFQADGGLVPVGEDRVMDIRTRATEAIAAVLEELGLARVSREARRSVVAASGSDETESFLPGEVTPIADAIKTRGLTALDVVGALARRGFREEAENVLFMLRQRVAGDYMQTSAVVRGGRVISAVNDPNDYAGPGSGYRLDGERWERVKDIRGTLGKAEVRAAQERYADDERRALRLEVLGEAAMGQDAREVVIGISPAFGEKVFLSSAGHRVSEMLAALIDGVREGGGVARVVRCRHTADTSFLGLTAARLSGSGYGIGVQAKGTLVLHHRDRLPHMNLEIFSNAPLATLAHYRTVGRNAARFAAGETPAPVVVPTRGEALGARYHVPVAINYAIEMSMVEPDAAPIEVRPVFAEVRP
jgi:propanediol dehydratase large subunit